MNIKERILETLKKEFEPLGYRYLKSRSIFKRNVGKDIIVHLYYNASRFHREFTIVNFFLHGDFRDIKEVLHNQNIIDDIEYWYCGFACRLPWITPEKFESPLWDFIFCDDDTEKVVEEKLKRMAHCVRTYAIPYLEKLSHKNSALEEAIKLDQKFLLLGDEYLIPIMYCIWKHDKKSALDYLEERGIRLWKLVEPEEWEWLERKKKGETLLKNEYPASALGYEDYIEGAKKVWEWIESQEYDD